MYVVLPSLPWRAHNLQSKQSTHHSEIVSEKGSDLTVLFGADLVGPTLDLEQTAVGK